MSKERSVGPGIEKDCANLPRESTREKRIQSLEREYGCVVLRRDAGNSRDEGSQMQWGNEGSAQNCGTRELIKGGRASQLVVAT